MVVVNLFGNIFYYKNKSVMPYKNYLAFLAKLWYYIRYIKDVIAI